MSVFSFVCHSVLNDSDAWIQPRLNEKVKKRDVFHAVTGFMSFSYESKIGDPKLGQDSW